jgi:hypothetical protein
MLEHNFIRDEITMVKPEDEEEKLVLAQRWRRVQWSNKPLQGPELSREWLMKSTAPLKLNVYDSRGQAASRSF